MQDWHSQCNEIVRSRIKEKQGSSEFKDPSELIEADLEEFLKKKIKKEVQDEKWPCLFCEKVHFKPDVFIETGSRCFKGNSSSSSTSKTNTRRSSGKKGKR